MTVKDKRVPKPRHTASVKEAIKNLKDRVGTDICIRYEDGINAIKKPEEYIGLWIRTGNSEWTRLCYAIANESEGHIDSPYAIVNSSPMFGLRGLIYGAHLILDKYEQESKQSAILDTIKNESKKHGRDSDERNEESSDSDQ